MKTRDKLLALLNNSATITPASTIDVPPPAPPFATPHADFDVAQIETQTRRAVHDELQMEEITQQLAIYRKIFAKTRDADLNVLISTMEKQCYEYKERDAIQNEKTGAFNLAPLTDADYEILKRNGISVAYEDTLF